MEGKNEDKEREYPCTTTTTRSLSLVQTFGRFLASFFCVDCPFSLLLLLLHIFANETDDYGLFLPSSSSRMLLFSPSNVLALEVS